MGDEGLGLALHRDVRTVQDPDHLGNRALHGLAAVPGVLGGDQVTPQQLGQRRHFIARRQSYHGNTLGALAVGGNKWRREPFAPILIPVTHVAPCYPYREQNQDETPQQYGQRLAQELEETVQRLGPDQVIAFVAETVGGATAGVLVPVPGYFKAVREV